MKNAIMRYSALAPLNVHTDQSRFKSYSEV